MIDKPAVDHLHMVELRLTGSSPCDVQADGIQTEMRFLYGVGTGGLTTFEQQMHGKTPGDTFSMRVDAQNLATDFAHLRQTLVKAVGRTLPLDLEIEIVSVRRATDREVFDAMAHQGEDSGGCGGGCGCGC